MRCLVFADLHLSEERLRDQQKLLHFIAKCAFRYEVKTVVFAGDAFHDRRAVPVVCSNLLFEFVHLLNDNDVGFCAIAGNHDRPFDGSETSALANLKYLSAKNVIVSGVEPFFFHELALVPFTESMKMKKNFFEVVKRKKEKYVVTHAPFNIGIKEYEKSKVTMSVFEKFPSVKRVIAGDFHTPLKKGKLIYVGAPMDFNFGDAGCLRRVLLLDTEREEIKFLPTLYPHFVVKSFSADEMGIQEATKTVRESEGMYLRFVFTGNQEGLLKVPVKKLKEISVARETDIVLELERKLGNGKQPTLRSEMDIHKAFFLFAKRERMKKKERKYGSHILMRSK
jgi:DNA repair exonuclease SbcCD nuclease subunit